MDRRWREIARFPGRVAATLAGLGLVAGAGSELLAQGCAMCRSSAQALGQFSPLNAGVVVLGVPPVMILALFLYLAFRRQP